MHSLSTGDLKCQSTLHRTHLDLQTVRKKMNNQPWTTLMKQFEIQTEASKLILISYYCFSTIMICAPVFKILSIINDIYQRMGEEGRHNIKKIKLNWYMLKLVDENRRIHFC